MNDFFAAAADALERRAVRQTAESEEFGKLVNEFAGGYAYERFDKDGRLVSSLVYETPDGGRLAYRLVGVSCADLL